MRRRRTVQRSVRASVGITFIAAIVVLASLAVLAAQWRRSETGVIVDVRGAHVVEVDAVKMLAAVADTSVLADIDLATIQRRIEKHPFVRSAIVRRDPPRTLVVELIERVPVAMVVGDGPQERMIDADGVVLPVSQGSVARDLPVITGVLSADFTPGRRVQNPRVLEAVRLLRTADSLSGTLCGYFSEINLAKQRDIVLYTHENGVPVLFGTLERAAVKLLSFQTFWNNVAMKHDLSDIEYVDLRFRDQVVVRRHSAADTLGRTAPADTIKITSD